LPVAGTEALTTAAVIVGALQLQRPQRAGKRLLAPPGIADRLTAGADTRGRLLVAMVGVEPLFDSACRQAQRLPPNG